MVIEVTVIDRGAEVANFSSFANAGLVAPGHAFAVGLTSSPRHDAQIAVAQ